MMFFRQSFIAAILSTLVSAATAQSPYPVVETVPVLHQAEYFIDTDPGVGNGRPVSLPTVSAVSGITVNADLTGLRPGMHRLYVRTRDLTGRWSLTSSFVFGNLNIPGYPGPGTLPEIMQLEYFLDRDPGAGNATPVELAGGVDWQNRQVVINIGDVGPGIHQLYLRARDTQGRWSLMNIFHFDNTQMSSYPVAGPLQPLSDIEYYLDQDPGFGNATAIDFTPGTDVSDLSIQVPLNTLTPGPHTIHLRSRSNPWGLNAWIPFNYGSVLPLTWLFVRGEMHGNQSVIDWATVSETRTDSFFIEHSTDGRLFRVAGKLPAAGNSQETRYYQFIHDQPQPGMNYYRIQQHDEDGRFSYSNVISLLNVTGMRRAEIAPNPVANMLYIALPQGRSAKLIEIYDNNGRLLLRRQELSPNSLLRVPAGQFVPGIYVVKILYDGGDSETLKFVKAQ